MQGGAKVSSFSGVSGLFFTINVHVLYTCTLHMQEEWTRILEERGEEELTFELLVEEARCKTGNKLYSFPLSD